MTANNNALDMYENEIMCTCILVFDDGTWYMHFPLTQSGATPLFIASQDGYSDVVNILIRNGADVNLARHVRYSYT